MDCFIFYLLHFFGNIGWGIWGQKYLIILLTGKGGITSHAAIVSRELGKPCIIAIKDITRILKTGDMVEMDADKGIVKIIK